jgi:hypothetical protein
MVPIIFFRRWIEVNKGKYGRALHLKCLTRQCCDGSDSTVLISDNDSDSQYTTSLNGPKTVELRSYLFTFTGEFVQSKTLRNGHFAILTNTTIQVWNATDKRCEFWEARKEGFGESLVGEVDASCLVMRTRNENELVVLHKNSVFHKISPKGSKHNFSWHDSKVQVFTFQ